MSSGRNELNLYQTEDSKTRIEARLQDETVWLSQKLISELFQKDVRMVNEHIVTIYHEGELHPVSNIWKSQIAKGA